jgi:hypothetical protein
VVKTIVPDVTAQVGCVVDNTVGIIGGDVAVIFTLDVDDAQGALLIVHTKK